MFKNIKLINRYLYLVLILLISSDFTLYASDKSATLGVFNSSFDGDNDSSKKSKKRRKDRNSVDAVKDTLDVNIRYKVVGGVLTQVGLKKPLLDSLSTDSLRMDSTQMDSIRSVDSISVDSIALDSLGMNMLPDSTTMSDSLFQSLPKKEQRKLNKDMKPAKYNRYFRDSIPISRMTAISLVVPGFSQLYNDQVWKIPVLYGTAGSALFFGIKQNKTYSKYKSEYDAMLRRNATREELNPVQTRMIQHNTYRQLLFAGALVSYVYFLGDGVVNYDGAMTSVKKATTLSTICPGAGQFYNKSYWKVPIVMGGFATMAYVIDFNNRGYQRFKLASDLVSDGDDSTIDEFNGRYDADYLNNLKRSYRRNRDLSLIITAGLYLLNIVDAHVDAHLQDYDVSDDLSMNLEPIFTNIYSQSKGNQNLFGMTFNIKF